MKALYFEEHGGTDKLLYGERPEPEPGMGEVRVRLKTTALNHLDLFVLQGMPGIPIGLPHIGGADGAGIVDAVGGGVEGVEVGAEVVLTECNSCVHNLSNAKLRKQKFKIYNTTQFINELMEEAK